MSASSIAAAKTDLFNLLAADTNGTPLAALAAAGVTNVYSYEPAPGDLLRGTPVTIFTQTLAVTDYVFLLRVYQHLYEPQGAQDALDAAVWAVDTALDASAEFVKTDWSFGWDANVGALVAQTSITTGRLDLSN